MEDKPIVEIRAINYFKFVETENGTERQNFFHHLVFRREGEETFKKIKVNELHISEMFNSEFKLP